MDIGAVQKDYSFPLPSVYTVLDFLLQMYTAALTFLCLVCPYPQYLNVDRVVERNTW